MLSVPITVAAESNARSVEQVYVDQSVVLFSDGNYSAALTQFQTLLSSSRDAQQRIRLQCNVARCLEMLGHFEAALAEFYAYQSIIKDPKRKSRALGKINQLHPKVYGSLSVICSEETAFEVHHRPNTTRNKRQNFNPWHVQLRWVPYPPAQPQSLRCSKGRWRETRFRLPRGKLATSSWNRPMRRHTQPTLSGGSRLRVCSGHGVLSSRAA